MVRRSRARSRRSSAPISAQEFDAAFVLASGMVLVFEPIIWEEGVGGFRAEEIVVVTDDGYEVLSHVGTSAWS